MTAAAAGGTARQIIAYVWLGGRCQPWGGLACDPLAQEKAGLGVGTKQALVQATRLSGGAVLGTGDAAATILQGAPNNQCFWQSHRNITVHERNAASTTKILSR